MSDQRQPENTKADEGSEGIDPQNGVEEIVQRNPETFEIPSLDLNRIFLREDMFPEAAQAFLFRRRPVEQIFRECLVVLDANVLLLPYKTESGKLQNIKQAYQSLITDNRLRIPAQVIREYLIHQADHLGESVSFVHQLNSNEIKVPSSKSFPIFDHLDEYQKVKDAKNEIQEAISKYKKTVKELQDRVRSWTEGDPVSELYGIITPEHIIEPTIDRVALIEDLYRRNKYNIPPGYKDRTKGDAGIGDLLIWKTILQLGEREKRPLIFVSGDKKIDWSIKRGSEIISPRIELIDEYRRFSNGNGFYILLLSELIRLTGATEAVVQEVRQVEEEQRQDVLEASITDASVGAQLIMQLTMEMGIGRETQVQPPYEVWRQYFGFDPDNLPSNLPNILLRNQKQQGALPEVRPVVKHHHTWSIEITDARLPRPAILRLKRVAQDTYDYWVYREGTDPEYVSWNSWLSSHPNEDRIRGRFWGII